MERLELKREIVIKTITVLRRSLEQPYSEFVQDSVIVRFGFCFEAFWKYLKEYVQVVYGKASTTPKASFRNSLTAEIINEDECQLFLQMTDDRNLITHTYEELIATELFKKIPEFAEAMEKVVDRLK